MSLEGVAKPAFSAIALCLVLVMSSLIKTAPAKPDRGAVRFTVDATLPRLDGLNCFETVERTFKFT